MAPQPELNYFSDPPLAAWEWAGDGPPLFFAHPTGFHGRIWDHIIRQFPGRRAIAIEFRGHGRSFKPDPPIPWSDFGRDVVAAVEHFGVHDAVATGHSMGGHAITEAAAVSGVFSALVLADPVIMPPEFYGWQPLEAGFILRRRNQFSSAQEMFERFRPRFPNWPEEVVRNYCDYALLPAAGGDGFVLACPPPTEFAIYTNSNAPESNIHRLLGNIRIPVVILRAGTGLITGKFDPVASPTTPDLASRLPNAREILLERNSHFIPMEAADVVMQAIGEAV